MAWNSPEHPPAPRLIFLLTADWDAYVSATTSIYPTLILPSKSGLCCRVCTLLLRFALRELPTLGPWRRRQWSILLTTERASVNIDRSGTGRKRRSSSTPVPVSLFFLCLSSKTARKTSSRPRPAASRQRARPLSSCFVDFPLSTDFHSRSQKTSPVHDERERTNKLNACFSTRRPSERNTHPANRAPDPDEQRLRSSSRQNRASEVLRTALHFEL